MDRNGNLSLSAVKVGVIQICTLTVKQNSIATSSETIIDFKIPRLNPTKVVWIVDCEQAALGPLLLRKHKEMSEQVLTRVK